MPNNREMDAFALAFWKKRVHKCGDLAELTNVAQQILDSMKLVDGAPESSSSEETPRPVKRQRLRAILNFAD